MLAVPARILVNPTIPSAAPAPLSRHVCSPPCLQGLYSPAKGANIRLASLRLPSRRCFSSSLLSRSPEPSSSQPAPVPESKPAEGGPTQTNSNSPGKSIWSRFLPSNAQESGKSASSFRKFAALALPEKKPLGIAIGLLLVSSSVSMSVSFTIGKLIDYFSTVNPEIPFGLSTGQASVILLLLFTAGATANAGHTMLIRLAGQRIVARLRERTYAAALRQEVEFVEKGEGDVLSRLSVDSSIVGESVRSGKRGCGSKYGSRFVQMGGMQKTSGWHVSFPKVHQKSGR